MLPTVSNMPAPLPDVLPALPKSWSELSWRQLCDVWQVKMRYGGNADVARAAALLCLCGCSVCRRGTTTCSTTTCETTTGSTTTGSTTTGSTTTGEALYLLQDGVGGLWTVTPRELSQMAMEALPWFDWPYGDRGEDAVKDEKGKVTKEARDAVVGYVNPNFRDAMTLPVETVTVDGVLFALPQIACNSLTWQQYRALQGLVPQLFQEGVGDDEALDVQAQFLAHCLVPARKGASDGGAVGHADPFAPKHDFKYNAERAEQAVAFWRERLAGEPPENRREWWRKTTAEPTGEPSGTVGAGVLFNICFQMYHTAVLYYEKAYPLLFQDGGKNDPMRDALQGEVGTINTIMKYAGYAEQQQVYDSNLPFVLDILNTMTKEAKEIEAMNAKIKKKK